MHRLLREVDWTTAEGETLGLFRDLLRHDTTNPPGDETACAEHVADHLRGSGLEPQVLESAPGRANVVARLRGADRDEPPLLLNAHLDVVPAEPDRWTHPPFDATVADGFVWGRGAVDMKNMAAMSLGVIRLLASSGAPLRRDVIFAGVADEEAGCEHGSAWLVDHHPDLVRAGFALGEVGGFTMHVGGTPIYPVQVAEKGVCWVRARARGATGHGSMPREDNAVVRLAAFLERVGRSRLKLRRSSAIDRFVAELAATQGRVPRAVLRGLLDPRLSGLLTSRVLPDRSVGRMFEAILRNTATPTILRAGSKINVIPGAAEAELDGRVAVGSTTEELMAELRRLAGPHIELEVLKSRSPHEAPVDTTLFDTIRDVVSEHHPGAVAVPSVIPGFTDAHYWSRLGAVCYGFSPVRLRPEHPPFAELFHGDDERIPVDGFTAGFRMLADAVFRFAAGE
jgi:acetylornithine deacetylase/succinyl-diaminopimelate desuccinylase-like protein